MSAGIIISYDGTPNDDDALALGRMLAKTGASLALAYVRHAHEFDPRREELAQHDAERRLELGAAGLGAPDVPRHVIVNPSTGEGLLKLAESEGASMIVFGSDYRTPPGHAEPGTSAQFLLEGGPVAVAVAAAGLRAQRDGSIGTVKAPPADADSAAVETANALAAKLGATIVDSEADLVVVGSSPTGPEGRISLSGQSRSQLNSGTGSVLVVPRAKPVAL
jgi:nucleotide-binding universal stress UspA family protein